MYNEFLKLMQGHKGNKNNIFPVLEPRVMEKQSLCIENFLIIQRKFTLSGTVLWIKSHEFQSPEDLVIYGM